MCYDEKKKMKKRNTKLYFLILLSLSIQKPSPSHKRKRMLRTDQSRIALDYQSDINRGDVVKRLSH